MARLVILPFHFVPQDHQLSACLHLVHFAKQKLTLLSFHCFFCPWPSPPTITVLPCFPALGWEHIASCEFSRGPLWMLSSKTVKLKFMQERRKRETTALLVPTALCNVAGAEELVSIVPFLTACHLFKVFQLKPGFSHSTFSPS